LSFIKENLGLFIILIFCTWAFWGGWKVLDILTENNEILRNLEERITKDLPNSNIFSKALYFLTFIICWITWMGLPLIIFGFGWTLIEDTKTPFIKKIGEVFKEYVEMIFGLTALISLFLIGTLFLAFYGKLFGFIAAIAIIIYVLIRR